MGLPLESKYMSENISKCFKDILKKCGGKPERLNTDMGSERICKQLKKCLKEEKLSLISTLRKCPVIEHFKLTNLSNYGKEKFPKMGEFPGSGNEDRLK